MPPPIKPLQDLFCTLLGVDDARVRHSSGNLRLDPLAPRAEVSLCGYQVWDASGQGGPYYTLRTRYTAEGMRTEPQLVTARRPPSERPIISYHPVR